MSNITERVERTLHQAELQAQSIQNQMENYEQWGSGAYYKHRLAMIKREIADLKYILGTGEDSAAPAEIPKNMDELITTIRETTNCNYPHNEDYHRGVADVIRILMEVAYEY